MTITLPILSLLSSSPHGFVLGAFTVYTNGKAPDRQQDSGWELFLWFNSKLSHVLLAHGLIGDIALMTPTPRLVLICGLPGSGKTTLARQLAEQLPALRLCGDEWMLQLGFDLFDEAAGDRIEVLFWELTQRLLQLGQSVIVESGFWLHSDRDEKRLGARALGARVELHVLDVSIDELWHRPSSTRCERRIGAAGTRACSTPDAQREKLRGFMFMQM